MIKARLIAGDTSVDFILAPFNRFAHEFTIGEERSGHRDQISVPARQHFFCHTRRIDPVGGDHRHRDMLAQLASHAGERGPWHHRRDRRYRAFMPSKVSRDNRNTSLLEPLRQSNNFVPAHAAFQHVHRRDAENDDKIRSNSSAGLLHYLQRKPHPVFIRTAVSVVAQIGLFNKECGNQISGRSNDLDTIIARFLCHDRTANMVADLFLDTIIVKRGWNIMSNARPYSRGCNCIPCACKRARVKYLHADFYVRICRMDRFSHEAVLGCFFFRRHGRTAAG